MEENIPRYEEAVITVFQMCDCSALHVSVLEHTREEAVYMTLVLRGGKTINRSCLFSS